MFLLVPAHPGFPGQIPQSRKTVVCVCVCYQIYTRDFFKASNCQISDKQILSATVLTTT